MNVLNIIFAVNQSFAFLSRKAFKITETELKVIAALAIIGDKSKPKIGYKTPAATGTPIKCGLSKPIFV